VARGAGRGVPANPAEAAMERMLRRVDRVVAEAEHEAFAAPDEARALCLEARALADRLREARQARSRGQRPAVANARRTALGWLRANRARIHDVLHRLESDRDVDGLVGCIAALEHAVAQPLQPVRDIRKTGRKRLRGGLARTRP
jgi:hypothetical protein